MLIFYNFSNQHLYLSHFYCLSLLYFLLHTHTHTHTYTHTHTHSHTHTHTHTHWICSPLCLGLLRNKRDSSSLFECCGVLRRKKNTAPSTRRVSGGKGLSCWQREEGPQPSFRMASVGPRLTNKVWNWLHPPPHPPSQCAPQRLLLPPRTQCCRHPLCHWQTGRSSTPTQPQGPALCRALEAIWPRARMGFQS